MRERRLYVNRRSPVNQTAFNIVMMMGMRCIMVVPFIMRKIEGEEGTPQNLPTADLTPALLLRFAGTEFNSSGL